MSTVFISFLFHPSPLPFLSSLHSPHLLPSPLSFLCETARSRSRKTRAPSTNGISLRALGAMEKETAANSAISPGPFVSSALSASSPMHDCIDERRVLGGL